MRISSGSGGLLEPLRGIDRVAGDERRVVVAGDHLAAVDADPDPELRPPLAGQLLVQPGQRLAHLDGGPNRAQRVVLVHGRNAEHRHHRVADELLDRAAVPLERLAHRAVPARHQAAQRLGVEPLAELGRVGEVAEQHRHRLPRLGRRRAGGSARAGATAARRARGCFGADRSSAGSCVRICWCSSRSAGPGSMPSPSTRAVRAAWYASSASACRPGAVQGEHQLGAEVLAERMLADERVELADQLRVASVGEVELDPLLDTREAKLLQAGDLGLGEALVGEVRERFSAPQRERLAPASRRPAGARSG